MKRIFLYFVAYFFITFSSQATHNRAGEITYTHISGLTYEFTITTYTYVNSPANRSELTIEWGDNTASVAPLVYRVELPNEYYHNIYKATHTFPGPGFYQVLVQDPNRNLGIENIPNSVNVVFSIKTSLIINFSVGDNSSPILLNPPKDRAALGLTFIHNPAAFDPDGDSLSYKLTVCTGQDGIPISNYSLPRSSDTLYVDPVSGDLVWDAPTDTGKFNIAMNIEEWRNGVKIGNIVRDMQVDVFRTDNHPPVNPETFLLCVEAGTLVEFSLTTTDEDNDRIFQDLNSGILILSDSSATFEKDSSGRGFSTSTLRWQTSCDHVRNQPYQLTLNSEDDNAEITLVDITNYYIKVIAPAPKGLASTSTSTHIDLEWEKSICNKADGYAIYRKEGAGELNLDSCTTGVPAGLGFMKIGETSGINDTVFTDVTDLVQGIEYCYVVTALFPDGAESYASEQVCQSLIPGMPALTNASVLVNDAVNGQVMISWVKPNIDTLSAPGPYVYQIFRSQTLEGQPELIDSIVTANLGDTIYIDAPLNTEVYPYFYSVKLINNTPGNRFQIGDDDFTERASTLYAELIPSDNVLILNFRKWVPWINTEYTVYRQNQTTLLFDSIGVTSAGFYVDSNLNNGTQYCYRLRSRGWRPFDSLIYSNENISHITCGIPYDIAPPCPPVLSVNTVCDSSLNRLVWTSSSRCADDVIRYNIYYSNSLSGEPDSIASTFSSADTVFAHILPDEVQLAGCYEVTAVDSFENESVPSLRVCVDECYLYELPNVFTPNNDNENDFFMAYNRNNAVKQINLKIFNRWGQLVYETTDPNFQWDGKILKTGNLAATGVYYYICDVYEPRLQGIYVRNIAGFVHIFAEEGQQGAPLPE